MNIEKDDIKKVMREWTKKGFIVPDSIPSIELYMDQVTTFMDKYLTINKRNEDDKTLTKTMINNYTKNNLLPSPEKKRYSKEHIIVLIYIYYLKSFISINDIQTMMKPLLEEYFGNDSDCSLEQIYEDLFKVERYQYFNVEKSILRSVELAEKAHPDDEDPYLKDLTFLSLIAYDVFLKKKLMESIIDDMRKREQSPKTTEKKQTKDAKENKEKTAKEKAAKEKATKEKATKEKATKEKATKEKATKENVVKDKFANMEDADVTTDNDDSIKK